MNRRSGHYHSFLKQSSTVKRRSYNPILNAIQHSKTNFLLNVFLTTQKIRLYLCSLLLPPLFLTNVYAENRCTEIGKFISIEGKVEIQPDTKSNWLAARMDFQLCEGDTVSIGENSRAAIQLINHSVLRLSQNTNLQLINIADNTNEWTWLDLGKGAIHVFSRSPWKVEIRTPSLKGRIDGTEFYVRADSSQSELAVLEGRVKVENAHGLVTVDPGQKAVAQEGHQPIIQTMLHPRDGVQWTLYYPPVLPLLDGSSDTQASPSNSTLNKAFELVRLGQNSIALNTLDHIPQKERTADFTLYRAAILLSIGRADLAKNEIAEALQKASNNGLAYSLLSIIELVHNQKDKALTDAEKAWSISPTVSASIALSYAQQANFRLEAASQTLLAAAEKYPTAFLVWARLAELQLMLGERKLAYVSAQRAIALSPDSAHAQLVLGFCHLAEFRFTDAILTFTQTIKKASADPMAHLGLGLAKISTGDLVEGRREIEAAVALDSNNSLLRSYLGKAYFAEKRTQLDAAQFSLAKSLDPLDPTPFLYDGIRKQAENRPIDAMHDLQKSKELNGNRAVYRSRFLLDKDRAARGISLARVYKDLGFNTISQREASISLEAAPADASAHRFLSDSYQGMRRREISRVSELLQAQLLQDININPIQPSLAETNLNIFTQGGPAAPGFNEFTPLFEQNTAKIDANVFGGSNNTFGGEGAITALYKRLSFSAAGLHYQSDGWRANNGLDQHIYNLFAQAAVTPELNIQAEYRHREVTEGDLALNFDSDLFVSDKLRKRQQDMTRFGLRYSPNQNSNLLFSYIHTDLAQRGSEGSQQIDPTKLVSSYIEAEQHNDQFEGQYLFEEEAFNLVAGFAHSQAEQRDNVAFTVKDSSAPQPETQTIPSSSEITSTRGYLYSHVKLPKSLIWTLGFSYADYKENTISESSFDPKFGVQWNLTQNLKLRAAWMRTLKPALVNNRTIEPTHVAGFNQLFDDINGTRSTRYGVGIDWQITPSLFTGAEISWRDIEEPFSLDSNTGIKNQHEDYHSLYLNWTPSSRIAVRAEFSYDFYRSQIGADTESGSFPPLAVETFTAPLFVSYFDPSGWFARLGGTYVHQNLKLDENAPQKQGNDSFFLVDADIGYRLPKRYGVVSFGVKNLFDTKFNYQDDSFREFKDEPASTGPYFPDRILIGRLILNF
jgi:tetratricopeptide (TPR) repeat protein